MKKSDTVHFTKMQGAGNDYIYVNTLLYSIDDPSAVSRKWSDRHFGIGGDGLVLIGKPSNPAKADFSMRIFNADGSEAMMCGNASRCIGKYVYEKGLINDDIVRLETLSGIKILNLHIEDKEVKSVTVDMGEPAFNVPKQFTGETPKLSTSLVDKVELMPLSHALQGTQQPLATKFVSMGNPHFVMFVDKLTSIDVAKEGSRLEYDKAFPERCNIEFAEEMSTGQFRTRVWERGSGITMACGTGACATAVAAASLGLSGRKSDIVMDGGTLHIEWNESTGHVMMTGPAAFSFEGEAQL